MRLCLWHDRIWVLQGGLSRNKVAVGESAAGSPPKEIKKVELKTDHKVVSVPPGIRGLVAQLEERGVCNAEAWGSNPHGSTGVSKILDAPGMATRRGRV